MTPVVPDLEGQHSVNTISFDNEIYVREKFVEFILYSFDSVLIYLSFTAVVAVEG